MEWWRNKCLIRGRLTWDLKDEGVWQSWLRGFRRQQQLETYEGLNEFINELIKKSLFSFNTLKICILTLYRYNQTPYFHREIKLYLQEMASLELKPWNLVVFQGTFIIVT